MYPAPSSSSAPSRGPYKFKGSSVHSLVLRPGARRSPRLCGCGTTRPCSSSCLPQNSAAAIPLTAQSSHCGKHLELKPCLRRRRRRGFKPPVRPLLGHPLSETFMGVWVPGLPPSEPSIWATPMMVGCFSESSTPTPPNPCTFSHFVACTAQTFNCGTRTSNTYFQQAK